MERGVGFYISGNWMLNISSKLKIKEFITCTIEDMKRVLDQRRIGIITI